MDDNILFKDSLQEIEDRLSGGIVTSFVVLAEVHLPNEPDGVLYRFARHGSPAMLLGLSSYLDTAVRDDVEDGMEDE